MRMDRPDVVHTHNSGIHHYAAVAARLAGVPVVVNTRHSPFAQENLKREKHYRWSVKLTDKVVFVSESTRKQVLKELALTHFSSAVILNGIPIREHLIRNPSSCTPSPANCIWHSWASSTDQGS